MVVEGTFHMAPLRGRLVQGEDGQSVLEFLLMLPMLVGLTVMLIRVNTVIQISIVNQQYARAEALWLTFNSAFYPELRHRETNLVSKGYNQMILGVSDNAAPESAERYTPKASVQNIARKRGLGSNEPQSEPAQRAMIRVRNTVTLCTPLVVLSAGGNPLPMLPVSGTGNPLQFKATGPWAWNEGMSKFDYCRSPVKYE